MNAIKFFFGTLVLLSSVGCKQTPQKTTYQNRFIDWRKQALTAITNEILTVDCPVVLAKDSIPHSNHYRFIENIPIEKEWLAIKSILSNSLVNNTVNKATKRNINTEILLINTRIGTGYDYSSPPICSFYIYQNSTPLFYTMDLNTHKIIKDTSASFEETLTSYSLEKKCFASYYTSYCDDITTVYTLFDAKGNILKIKTMTAFCQ